MPSSSIDTSGIDVDYPIAGEDNDSQGFRTNFTEIKAALDAATSDINTLFVTGGYAGSRGVIGYSGSAGVAGSAGGLGYTGSAGAGGGGGGYTGSASTVVGYSGSAGDVGIGYTGSASTVVGYSGSAGASGGGGGGLTWTYQTSSFSAVAGGNYYIAGGAPIIVTLPTPSDGDTVLLRGTGFDFTNDLTINDDTATLVATINTFTFDILLRYSSGGGGWFFIRGGSVATSMPDPIDIPDMTDLVPVYTNSDGNRISPTAISISDIGKVTIPAPTDFGVALEVSAGVSGDPAVKSNGGAYTTSVGLTSVSGVLDIDCSLSNVFYTTLTENITDLNLNNPSNGQTINVLFKQGTGGGFTMSWGTVSNSLKWPNAAYEPPLSTFAAERDLFVATYIDIGTDAFWYCTLTNDFTSPA